MAQVIKSKNQRCIRLSVRTLLSTLNYNDADPARLHPKQSPPTRMVADAHVGKDKFGQTCSTYTIAPTADWWL